ncbi:MAG: hypothetical protein BWY70_00148 [Bacteroidetes bacterium ADurb.Bin408]|nr:MAG: hypothetical protein BWY70_00148 [Bacteroidetes bacterium ADurb.Bin408]
MNTMNKTKVFLLAILAGIMVFTSCVKQEFDTPPIKDIPVGSILTVAQLRALYTGVNVKFVGDSSVYATVTMDDKNGNIYKNFYIQDGTGSIVVRTLSSGGVYQGDSVRIYLKGTVLSAYNGMLQLDSVDVDKNVIKQKNDVVIAPTVVNITDINSSIQGKLVKLEGVQFNDVELGKTYADKPNLVTVNRTLEDCFGNQIIVRTSGYASFAGDTVASGNGSLVAIVGEYNGTMQLYLRSKEEILLTGTRCGGGNFTAILQEDFSTVTINSDVNINGWQTQATAGSKKWRGKEYSGNQYAEMSAYQSAEASNIGWLISPPINLTGYSIYRLNFETEFSYWTHDAVTVYISTNFDGTNIAAATWTPLADAYVATDADGYNNWIPSGNSNLTTYAGSTVYIGFKYEGSGTGGQTSTYRVDNFKVLGGN